MSLNDLPSPKRQHYSIIFGIIGSIFGIIGTIATILIYFAAKDGFTKIQGFDTLLKKNDSLNQKIYDLNVNVVKMTDSIAIQNKIMREEFDTHIAEYKILKVNDQVMDISAKSNFRIIVKQLLDISNKPATSLIPYEKVSFSIYFLKILNEGEKNSFLFKNKRLLTKWNLVKSNLKEDFEIVEKNCHNTIPIPINCGKPSENELNLHYGRILKEYRSLTSFLQANLN